MTYRTPAVCFFCQLLCLSPLVAQAYRTPEQVQETLEKMAAESGGSLTLELLGETLEKRKLTVATLALPGPLPPEKRQAILVVAGLEGNLVYTTEIVLEAIKALLLRAK